MYCQNCKTQLSDGSVFCSVCGAKQTNGQSSRTTCAKCGEPLSPGSTFCSFCGRGVNTGVRSTNAYIAPTNPYVASPQYYSNYSAPYSPSAAYMTYTANEKRVLYFVISAFMCLMLPLICFFVPMFTIAMPYYGAMGFAPYGTFELLSKLDELKKDMSLFQNGEIAVDTLGILMVFYLLLMGIWLCTMIKAFVTLGDYDKSRALYSMKAPAGLFIVMNIICISQAWIWDITLYSGKSFDQKFDKYFGCDNIFEVIMWWPYLFLVLGIVAYIIISKLCESLERAQMYENSRMNGNYRM